jgi:protein-tyrosine phosphatase
MHLSASLARPAAVAAAAAVSFALVPAAASAATPKHDTIPFTSASVVRQASGAYAVAWRAPGAGSVRVFLEGAKGPTGKALAAGASKGTATVSATGAHPSFALVPATGSALVLADRSVGLASIPNLRDAGGYRTSDGHWVQMGVLYRSNALIPSAPDATVLDGLGITTEYDLRTPAEATAKPDAALPGATRVALNVIGTDSPTTPQLTSPQDAIAVMEDGERQFVLGQSARTAFHDLLTGIATTSGDQLFHCSAGKDRSGWASAVLLSILGVPRATIEHDYLLSNDYLAASNAAALAAMPAAAQPIYQPLMGVDLAFLDAGFDQVQQTFGSMDAYVRKGLGVTPATIAALKAKLLVG